MTANSLDCFAALAMTVSWIAAPTTSARNIKKNGVNDGARTHDHRDHNPGLYQLSYAHHKIDKYLKV
jgi:hypothetical protein